MFGRWFGTVDNSPRGRVAGKNGTLEHYQLIDLRAVVKAYATPAGEFIALKKIDLAVSAGQFVAVVGKSGSGKSTLTNMITGIDRPTSGEVNIAGMAVHHMREGQIAKWRGRTIGVVFQFFQLLPTLTVVENVMLPMSFCNVHQKSERRGIAVDLLERVGMAEQRDKLPTDISGGQQQRVAIARALANDPPIIVADEPTGNLDSSTAETVFRLFAELVDGGKTILMVTHDDDLANQVTRTVVLADGQIVEDRWQESGNQSVLNTRARIVGKDAAEEGRVGGDSAGPAQPSRQSDPSATIEQRASTPELGRAYA